MVVNYKKYGICTKELPLKFDDGSGNMIDEIEDAGIGRKEDCEADLKCFDEPEKFTIFEVKVTYEF